MREAGHAASEPTLGRLLRSLGLSLKANLKSEEAGSNHPDRDRQFLSIAQHKARYLAQGDPVISVDTKKKELIGNFKQAGRLWCQQAERVSGHDFPSDADGRAVPYGIYDLTHNSGYVVVGHSADTPEFAVEAIVRWWRVDGSRRFPGATRLLILADSGGSNAARSRAFKTYVQQRLADEFGLDVTVCHYPRGCSKYNPVEHRLFSFISLNWAGTPLRSFQTALDTIRATTTEAGLKIKAVLKNKIYTKGVKFSDVQMKAINIERHAICPNWTYTIRPRLADS
jgi:hypothetical protein